MNNNTTPHMSTIYDKKVETTIPYYNNFHEETINLIKTIREGNPHTWLDTGCGTGNLVIKAQKQFKSTKFLMVDPSKEMIDIAKSKFSSFENIRFLEPTSTQKVYLENIDKPDVITAILSHHYLLKEERALATKVCYDLLQKEGIYITFENIRPFSEKGIAFAKERWIKYQIEHGKDYESAQKHLQRFDTKYFPITIDEHIRLLKECGFKIVELFWYSYMQAGFYCIK